MQYKIQDLVLYITTTTTTMFTTCKEMTQFVEAITRRKRVIDIWNRTFMFTESIFLYSSLYLQMQRQIQ